MDRTSLKNYRIKDAILEAGGLTKDASVRLGEIFRTDEKGQITQIYFEVGPAIGIGSGGTDVKAGFRAMVGTSFF